MKRTALFLVFVGTQFLSGLIAFSFWAVASFQITTEAYARAQASLAIAMVLYLPLSLGLPFLIATFYRHEYLDDGERLALAIRLPIYLSASVAIVAIACTPLISTASGALLLGLTSAGAVCLSTLALQIARLRMSLSWLTAGTALALLLPASVMAAGALVGSDGAVIVNATLFVGGTVIFAATAILLTSRRIAPSAFHSDAARRSLRSSTPLVPHLVAFGALTQGPRLAAAIGASPAGLIVQAGYAMQFMGIGFAGVSSVHGMWSAALQSAPVERFNAIRIRYAWLYAALGAFGAAAVPLAMVSPLRLLFAGMHPVPLGQLVAMSLCFAALTGYYFQSTCMVRQERTAVLAIFSVPVSFAYIVSAALVGDLSVQFALLAVALVALHVLAGSYMLMASRGERKHVLATLGVSSICYLVPLLVYVAAVTWDQPLYS